VPPIRKLKKVLKQPDFGSPLAAVKRDRFAVRIQPQTNDPHRRKIDLRPGEIDLSIPFGIASYSTVAGLRKLEYRELPAGQEK